MMVLCLFYYYNYCLRQDDAISWGVFVCALADLVAQWRPLTNRRIHAESARGYITRILLQGRFQEENFPQDSARPRVSMRGLASLAPVVAKYTVSSTENSLERPLLDDTFPEVEMIPPSVFGVVEPMEEELGPTEDEFSSTTAAKTPTSETK